MNIFESLRSAYISISSNKMRSILTMLGIIIGIGSVIMITSIGEGSRSKIMGQFNKLGVGGLSISVKDKLNAKTKDLLTSEDELLLRSNKEVKNLSPIFSVGGVEIKLRKPGEKRNAVMEGVNEEYRFIKQVEFLYGRFFIDIDNKIRSQVAIIDDSLAVKVFGREDVVGEKISLKTWKGTYKFTIIGVTKNPNALFETMFGDTFPAFVFVPLSTLHKLVGSEEIDSYSLTVNDDKLLDRTALELKALLEMKHSNKDKYLVENTMKNVEDVNQILGQITAFISFVAAISLLVGGIGVMNIMLVTVTERTKEIGIRKSIGAKNKDILIQFLIESVILTGIGGIIGMLVGYFGGVLIGSFMNIFPIMSPKVIIMTVIISSSIGIVFGVYPARKAAKLDPIEALRYE